MQTKELNDVFQNATEVTSLASTDRLAVIGADGEPRKFYKRLVSNANIQTKNKSWIRIGNTTDYGNSSLVVIAITETWNLGRPASIILAASLGCCHQKDVLDISEVRALSSNQRRNIIKARLVYDPTANTVYLDIIQDLYNNTIYIDFISVNNFSVNVQEAPAVTSGMEVKELNIIFGGG